MTRLVDDKGLTMKKLLGMSAIALLGMFSAGAPALPTAAVPGGGSAPSATTFSVPARTGSCHTDAPASARLAKGSHAKDPDDVSAPEARAIDARLRRAVQRTGLGGRALDPRAATVTVPVHVHVITRNDGSGNVSNPRIKRQIAVLNKSYGGRTSGAAANTPFRFRLKDTDRTAKTDWYNWSIKDDDRAAKRKLHVGGYDTLNIYVTGLQDGLLGYSYFPGVRLTRDGLVILNQSVPGGKKSPYDQGDTATHEIGHWLGLFHTFENGCDSPGDRVSDTPYQADGKNVYKCGGLDTCPSRAGNDPVHNFMNYSADHCLNQFTKGQSQRMYEAWLAYRASH